MLLSVLNYLCISFQSSVIIIYNLKICYRAPFDNFFPPFVDSLRHNWCWSHSPNTTIQQILLKVFRGARDHVHHTFQNHKSSAKKAKQNSPPPGPPPYITLQACSILLPAFLSILQVPPHPLFSNSSKFLLWCNAIWPTTASLICIFTLTATMPNKLKKCPLCPPFLGGNWTL